MSRQRKARAWGVEWARTSDSNWACLSALRDPGCAIGTGMVKLLIVQQGHRNLGQTYLLLFYTLSRPKYTGIGFMKWTSRPSRWPSTSAPTRACRAAGVGRPVTIK